jgi:hypothetical protein
MLTKVCARACPAGETRCLDLQMQALVRRRANLILYAAFLGRLIDLRLRKGRISPEGDLLACSQLALDRGSISSSQSTASTVAVLSDTIHAEGRVKWWYFR